MFNARAGGNGARRGLPWRRPGRQRRELLLATSAIALALANPALAADVEITSDTGAVNLDTETGSTVHIASGVTVGPGNPALSATLQPWTITNEGTVTGGNAVKLNQGGEFTNAAGATVNGSLTALTFGYKPIGLPPAGGPGTVNNYGTIIGGVEGVTMWLGGTVNNYAGGLIKTDTGLNAVSIGQGTYRTLYNEGTIQSNKLTGFSTGVLMQGGPSTFTNTATGVIFGDYNGVYASATAVFTAFNNAGSITSRRGPAVEAAGGGNIVNSGTIGSTNAAGMLVGGVATVTNRGTINGGTFAIDFTGAATHNLILDTGSVLGGNVRGGAGVDNLTLNGSGTESIAKFLRFENLTMNGTAWTLTDAGAFTTAARVDGGSLFVNGTLTSPTITVASAGLLGGTGTLAGAVVNQGTINAGAAGAIGTLSVTGSLTFEAGSTLQVDLVEAGATDLVAVNGALVINGGTVNVVAGAGLYLPFVDYTIMTSTGRTGVFDGATANYAFLQATLTYDAQNVYLRLVRNGLDFSSVGGTPNQIATGAAVEPLGTGNDVYDAVLLLNADQARYAFDQLSGEIHASALGTLMDDSRFVREAATRRILSALGSGASGATHGIGGGTYRDVGVWADTFLAQGIQKTDFNAADARHSIGGVFTGIDMAIGAEARAGVMAGYSHTNIDVNDRSSGADVDTVHVGIYGGGRWSGFGVRGGAAIAWHDIDVARRIAFVGFDDEVEADYSGHTGQVFGEAGYRFDLGRAAIEPIAQFAYVNAGTGSFQESDGDAALSSEGASMNTLFTTLGVRGEAKVALGERDLVLSGMIGWRHASGDRTPTIALAFGGGNEFVIGGAPMAKDNLVLEAGADLPLSESTGIRASYSGLVGDGSHSHAGKLGFSTRF